MGLISMGAHSISPAVISVEQNNMPAQASIADERRKNEIVTIGVIRLNIMLALKLDCLRCEAWHWVKEAKLCSLITVISKGILIA